MAVNRNAIYRYQTSRVRLEFVLGDTTYLSNPSIIKLPFDSILNTITLKRAFDNDFPFGMQLSDVLELEFDFLTLKQWNSEFANALENGFGDSYLFNLGWDGQIQKIFDIPNSIKVYVDNSLVFWGFQERKPETEYSIKNNKITLKITFIDAFRAVLEKFTIGEIIWDFGDVSVKNECRIIDYYYESNVDLMYVQRWNKRVAFISWNKLKNLIDYTASYIFKIFSRQNSIGIALNWNVTTDFLPGWKFYSFKTNSKRMEKDQLKQRNELQIIWEIYDKNLIMGGLAKQTISTWDFLKKLAENFLQKVSFTYNSSGNLEILFEPFPKNQIWSLFDSAKIGKEIIIRKNKNWIGTVKQQNEDAFEFDFKTIEHQNSNTEAEKSIEIEILFSNACLGNTAETQSVVNDIQLFYARNLINSKGIYFFSGEDFYKVSDQCYFSYYGDSTLPDELVFGSDREFIEKVSFRFQKSMHEIIQKVIEQKMMKVGNFEMEFEYMDIIPVLGHKVELTIPHLSWGTQYPVIVNTEIDLYKETTKVKLFCWKDATD